MQQTKRGLAKLAYRAEQPLIKLGGGADVKTVSPQDTSPFFSEFDLAIPRDLAVLNRLIDYYATFHPLVANSFDLHAEIAWSDFSITCADQGIKRDYEDLIEDINLKQLLWGCYHEWFKFGETILLGSWNENDKTWYEFTSIPMHKLKVERLYDPATCKSHYQYYYQVSPEDRRKMEAFTNTAGGQWKYWTDYVSYDLSTNFVEAFLNYGDIIPIHDFYVFRLVRLSSNYDLRGRSIGLRILRDALLEDYLLRAQLKVARDRVRSPDVWLVGAIDAPPDESELDYWRGLIEKQANDPNYQIVGAPPMEMRNYSSNLRLLQLEPEVNRLQERMSLGLWTPMEGLKNYAAATYAGQASLQQVRESRYSTYRKMMEEEIIRKIFMPVAVARKYIKKTKTADGGGELILPEIRNHLRNNGFREEINKVEINLAHLEEANYTDRVEQSFAEADSMVEVMKLARRVSKQDLDLPRITYTDRIRLQDATEKIRALLAIGKDYPIPFKFICEELGFDYNKIKEDLEMTKDEEEYWKPRMLRAMGGGMPMDAGMAGGGMPPLGMGLEGLEGMEQSPPGAPGMEMPGMGEGEALAGGAPPPIPQGPIGGGI